MKLKFCFLFLLSINVCYASKKPLYFGFINTFTGPFSISEAVPVVDIVLEHVNNRSDILQNYTLHYTKLLDSKCNRTVSLDAFFKLVNDNTNIVSLLGCGCPMATAPVAEISHYWNIPQLLFTSTSSELSDRSRFRNLFHILPSLKHTAASTAQLMRKFQWKKLAIISQEENSYIPLEEITDELEKIFNTEGWALDTSITLNMKNDVPFDKIFNVILLKQYNIIYMNLLPNLAFKVICAAYHKNVYSPKYIWLIPMWYATEWWNIFISDSNCTRDDIMQVLDGSIGVLPEGYSLLNDDTQVTFSGLTPKTFQEKFKTLFQKPEYTNYAFFDFGRFIYDGMWTLIVALDKTVIKISMGNDSGCEDKSGDMVPLEYFNYTNEKLGCIMKQSFSEVMFTGVTGDIQFDVNGSRPDNSLLVKQYRISSNETIRRDTIGVITVRDGNSSIFTFSIGESNSTIWKNGNLPYDGFPVWQIHKNHLALIIVYDIVALLGLGFAVFCTIFNIIFKHKKVIKLASPNLNYLIILGSVILFCCVFFYTYSSPDSAVQTGFCNTRTWLFSIGYTLCFAVILSKALRIYYIFNNPTPQKKALKDWVLLLPIISIVAIDLGIILVGSAIPQSRLMSIEHEDLEHMQEINDEGKIVHYSIYKCNQDGSIIWLAVSFGYKALLQLVAMFMAFHTRRVKVKALNDSKEIAVIIYINSIILTLLIVTEFTLVGYHNVYAALFDLGLLIDGFLFLGLIFIPKMISLYKDPKGDKIFSDSLITCTAPAQAAFSTETLNTLQAKVKELELKLNQQENVI